VRSVVGARVGESRFEDATSDVGLRRRSVLIVLLGERCDVRMVLIATAGQPDVKVLAVHTGPDEQDCDVGGGTLGGVDGGGPAVVDVLSHVPRRKNCAAAPGKFVDEQSAVLGRGEHPVAVAVADMRLAQQKATVVAASSDDVAGSEAELADHDFGSVRPAVSLRGRLGEGVESVNIDPSSSQHHGAGGLAFGGLPVRENGAGGLVGLVDGVKPAGTGVGVNDSPIAVSEPQGRRFLLVAEAVHAGQLDAVSAGRECGQHSTRPVDDSNLSWVTDENDFGLRSGSNLGQGVEVERRRHRDLVQDQNRLRCWRPPS
jgi:hypothetical protein